MERTKKKGGKAPKAKASGEMHADAPEAAHNFAVILERVEAQQRVVIEAVTGSREALERKIQALDVKLSGRIDVLEFVVRKNSEDIRKNSEDIRKNSEDIQVLASRLEAIDTKLDTKADASAVAELERRVTGLHA